MGAINFNSQHEQEIVSWLKKGFQQMAPKIRFNSRELEIIYKIAKGLTNKEISEEMQLSSRTIETYRYDLIKKAEVQNSIELIEFTFRNGIISPSKMI